MDSIVAFRFCCGNNHTQVNKVADVLTFQDSAAQNDDSAGPRKVLFINCPFGRFFRDLCAYGDAHGLCFERMAFDAGDYFEAPPERRHLFRGEAADWPRAIEARLTAGDYDMLILYNDALPFNEIAASQARRCGIPFMTLENGYLRPHWVTLEWGGVNGNSPLILAPLPPAPDIGAPGRKNDILFEHRMASHVYATIRHFLTAFFLSPFFPYRPHYYGISVIRQCAGYVREFLRRQRLSERKFREIAFKSPAGPRRHFLCLLQKPGDTQLRVHSDISTNTAFLEAVLTSFAHHAPKDAILAVKRHPYDYGIEKTPVFFDSCVRRLGLEDRCFLIERMKMFQMLDWAQALVVNNSSGGLEALHRGLPVKALGRAIYNRPGITFSGSLHSFWSECAPPDKGNVERFVIMLKDSSQLNGGFYTREARSTLFPNLRERLMDVMDQCNEYQTTEAEPRREVAK